jgi:hypothetical protein
MILGTANIFSVDQRTSALITHRMRGASKERVDEALKLAAMAEMCIYYPSSLKGFVSLYYADIGRNE